MVSEGLFVSEINDLPDGRAIVNMLLGQSPAGFVAIDSNGTVLLVNNAARRMFDYNKEPGGEITWGEIRKGGDLRWSDGSEVRGENDPLFAALREKRFISTRIRITTQGTRPERWVSFNSFPVVDKDGGVIGSAATILDITDLKGMQDVLYHQATHDSLTGLPNRMLFSSSLRRALAGIKRGKPGGAILAIDIDDFKKVNDTLGHAAGDELLVKIADRLLGEVRETDVVARIGGDEFSLLLLDMEGGDAAAITDQIARRICDALARPFSVRKEKIRITSSIGICLFPENGSDEETLLFRADTVMYKVKERGRNGWKFWAGAVPAEGLKERV